MKNNYCHPSTEVVDISTERQFLTSTETGAGIGNVTGTYYDFDWEDE